MEGFKYVIALFSSRNRKVYNIRKILEFSRSIADIYSVTYDEFSFSYRNGEISRTKTLKHTAKNILKLHEIDERSVEGLSFSKYTLEKHFSDPVLSLGFYISKFDDYPDKFMMIIDENQLKSGLSIDDLKKLIDNLYKLGFEVEYGAAFPMEAIKEPHYFIIGIATRYLSSEEQEMAKVLAINIREFRSKIWDVFLFNIIKKELVGEAILNNIKEIIPHECIAEKDEKYIISLPLQGEEYINDKEKLSMYREKLRQIFKENDLIMYKDF